MDTNGSNNTQLTSNNSVINRHPSWSPDGTLVAEIGRMDNTVTVDVFNADPAASDLPRRIYESIERPAFYLYWAPDSRHVTFLTTEPLVPIL